MVTYLISPEVIKALVQSSVVREPSFESSVQFERVQLFGIRKRVQCSDVEC
jgi:hypothetical protein